MVYDIKITSQLKLYTMGRGQKVFHNDIEYPTKSAFEKYCKCLVNEKIGLCDSVKSKDEKLFFELFTLLERHPKSDEYLKGVTDFKIHTNYYDSGFECIRLYDDKEIEKSISWIKAIKAKDTSSKHKLSEAMRCSVRYQIYNHKLNNEMKCAFCKSEDNLHCDHIIHFEKIKQDFLKRHHTFPKHFSKLTDGSNQTCFLDSDLNFEEEWKRYHKDNAKLRMLCCKCNLTRSHYKK